MSDLDDMMQHLDECRAEPSDDNDYECFRCGCTKVRKIDIDGEDTRWQCKRCGFGKGNRVT